jgi:hypothetical protein
LTAQYHSDVNWDELHVQYFQNQFQGLHIRNALHLYTPEPCEDAQTEKMQTGIRTAYKRLFGKCTKKHSEDILF